jgi:signal peptidase I
MNHTFENSDFILVDQLTYNFQNPKRGDIVVFKPPHKENMVKETGFKCLSRKVYTKITNGETNDPCYVSEYFVKRIIGLPGDTVEIKEGEVYVKPRFAKEKIKLEEPYLDKEHQGHTCLTQSNSCVTTLDKKGIEYIVPENTYFVLGDNRGGSNDSRFWREDETSSRFVPFDNLSGKVRIVLFPFHSFGTIADPEMAKIDEELAKTLRVESENK